jgi:hypothetical protein
MDWILPDVVHYMIGLQRTMERLLVRQTDDMNVGAKTCQEQLK